MPAIIELLQGRNRVKTSIIEPGHSGILPIRNPKTGGVGMNLYAFCVVNNEASHVYGLHPDTKIDTRFTSKHGEQFQLVKAEEVLFSRTVGEGANFAIGILDDEPSIFISHSSST